MNHPIVIVQPFPETCWRRIGDKIGLRMGRVKSLIYKDSAKLGFMWPKGNCLIYKESIKRRG